MFHHVFSVLTQDYEQKKKLVNCRGTRAKTRREDHIKMQEEVHYKTKVVVGVDVT